MVDPLGSKYEYPLLPLKNVVIFPRTIVTLLVGRKKSIQAVDEALEGDHRLIVSAQKGAVDDDPKPDDLYRIGTLVEVMQVQRQSDGNIQVVVEGLHRTNVEEFIESTRLYMVRASDFQETVASGPIAQALVKHVIDLFTRYAQLNKRIPSEAVDSVTTAENPGYLADMLAGHVISDVRQRQDILEMADQLERLEQIGIILTKELDTLDLEQKIRNKVRQQIDKNHREYYLREQLKAIHDELGGEQGNEIAELRQKIETRGLPDYAAEKMVKEITRLERMPAISPEATVVRNYIDWVFSLPWKESTADRLDIAEAERILDEDHYGLEEVKERIIEFLAVRRLTSEASTKMKGPILCLIGPPGVGKTSLGQSIARSMNRKFTRISLGGVRDEAEIRGHRRTYVGAMPGRIIQAMKTVGSKNPVILLDEIDKMSSDFRGDPAAALLEVLDPEQNYTFTDHYLDMPYDLSEAMFITTGNVHHTIPRPLRDRMEIIEISGYTEDEKIQIARRYLLPRQLAAHGLAPHYVEIPEKMYHQIIHDYTRESGVRNLERKLATICRKAARKIVAGRATRIRISQNTVEEYLGVPKYSYEPAIAKWQVGVATGLAWTEHGGELLPVEVATMPGRGNLIITGRLGDVMQESAKAALSYARSKADQLNIDPNFQEKLDLHIHLPEGAIPKDGPSAGITMATALISAITLRPVRTDLAMTGEITLTGRILPIGGLKEKVLAARRAGITTILAPRENRRDLAEIPRNVRRELEIIWVEDMDNVLAHALGEPESQHAAAAEPEQKEQNTVATPSEAAQDEGSVPTGHMDSVETSTFESQ